MSIGYAYKRQVTTYLNIQICAWITIIENIIKPFHLYQKPFHKRLFMKAGIENSWSAERESADYLIGVLLNSNYPIAINRLLNIGLF